jgi:hypothetical protein
MKILKVLAAIVVFFLTYFVYLLLAAPVWNLFFFSKTEPPPIAARIAIYLLALILVRCDQSAHHQALFRS